MQISHKTVPNWRGIMTALITPMHEGGKIDYENFDRLIEMQLAAGIHGLVPCGSTGEFSLLSQEEHLELTRRCVNLVAGRIPVIVGAGALSVEQTLVFVRQAEEAKADGVLIVSPAYVKPTQRALIEYYKAIHESTQLPIILYNNPARTGVDMSLAAIVELAHLPRIVGLKDSNHDCNRATRLRIALGDHFLLYAGDDPIIPGYLAHGGDGAISVISNAIPAELEMIYQTWTEGDLEAFKTLTRRILALGECLSHESNPVPIKYMAHVMGYGSGDVRSPLVSASQETRRLIIQALEEWEDEQAFNQLLTAKIANQL